MGGSEVCGSPSYHTFIATSDIHMEYKLKMKPEEVLSRLKMRYLAKSLCEDVEFSAEDGSRTRPEFLFKVIETAIEAGATTINIPDTVGMQRLRIWWPIASIIETLRVWKMLFLASIAIMIWEWLYPPWQPSRMELHGGVYCKRPGRGAEMQPWRRSSCP